MPKTFTASTPTADRFSAKDEAFLLEFLLVLKNKL
jgi:hypothetical protein